jgi:hypothetical protein
MAERPRDSEDVSLDVSFNLVRMTPTIHEDILYASVCEKFKGVLDQRRIREGEKTLRWEYKHCLQYYSGILTLGRSSVKGAKRVSNESVRIWQHVVSMTLRNTCYTH